MDRKMRRFFVLISCMCLFLCACGDNAGYDYYMEKEIISFVQEHEEELRRLIENAGQDGKVMEFDGIEKVEDRRDSYGVVYYEYIASGLMTSSLQAGFYYSQEDMPSSHGGAAWAGGYGWSEVSTQKENLWRYEEEIGDNYLITEKICDNFYYVLAGN